MQTGVVTSENLADVLRQVSQRRRQGILEIAAGNTQLHIRFGGGRIVDAVRPAEAPGLSTVERLARAGKIPGEIRELVESIGAVPLESAYRALFLKLNESPDSHLDEDEFRFALRHTVLDELYGLELGAGAYYSFKVQMVDYDRDLCPSLSVGQLLLDLAAIRSEWERFEGVFAGDVIVRRTGAEAGAFSEEEERVYALLEHERDLAEIRAGSMLSKFHVMETLLTFHDRGLIEVGERSEKRAEGPSQSPQSSSGGFRAGSGSGSSTVDDLVAALESSIDASFAEMEALEDEASFEAADALPMGDTAGVDQADGNVDGDEEAEGFGDAPVAAYRARLSMLNMRLLHSKWVPRILVVVFLAAALILPLLVWSEMIASFS